MQASEEHELRPSKKTHTPQPRAKPQPVIGSSCTWKRAELEHFNVGTVREVDVKSMIPERFFDFGHLEKYAQCTHSLTPPPESLEYTDGRQAKPIYVR
jgi:hypothetical protein